MCGIAGIFDSTGAVVDPVCLDAACVSMRHRGPDDSGTWIGRAGPASIGLAAVRLAVQDLTPAGHQPMTRADGRYVLVFNGEIYNFRELARGLRSLGERITSRGDTEVVLAACARWGPQALNRCDGMWALAFVDTLTGEGFLARDRYGIKPLVYSGGPRCCFASEMRTLRPLIGDRGRIDPAALLHYLRFGFIGDPHTIYTDCRRLPPGHYLPFGPAGVGEPVPFYVAPSESADSCVDYADACREVRELTFEAVARRRVADVSVGAFLSGGLDSSVIVAHLAACSPRPVRTFSIGYTEHVGYDETNFARLIAQRYGTEHHEIKLGYDDVFAELLPTIDHLGEPFADSSILPTALVSRFARQTVTVALSGDAGDELFGGYWRYLGHSSVGAYQRLPGVLRRWLLEPWLRAAPSSKRSGWRDRVRQFRKLLRAPAGQWYDRHLAWSAILAPEAEAVLSGRARELLDTPDPVSARLQAVSTMQADPLGRILAFDLRYGLPGDMLHKVDLASMRHSLEVRVPLLDVHLVEAVERLPTRFKVHRGLRKRLLIDAHRDLLPAEILGRSKRGFEVPVGEFLRGPLGSVFRDTVTPTSVKNLGLLDHCGIQQVFTDHVAERAEHADLLYALLVLCRWHARAGNPVLADAP